MKYNRSMKWFLLKTAFLFSFLGFFIIYWAANEAYVKAVKSNAIAVSNQLAINTFNSMFQVMRQGWTRTQLETFIGTLESTNNQNSHTITIFRGNKVMEEYGPIEQPALDAFNQRTLSSNSAHFDEKDDVLRYSYPLLARQECLACHTNVKPGEALGLIEVRQNLTPLMSHARDDLLRRLIYMAPFPFILSLIVIFYLNRRINRSMSQLEESIDKVNKVSDLNDLDLQQRDLGFSELNQVYSKVEGLAERMRTIAVDRELLEFEIRLLEKFIITSEVVRDWREYVSLLLNDINTVMNAYTLFSIFKVDDEVFDLEIFWYGPPTDHTRRMMEQEIRKALDNTASFRNLQTLKINHNIAGRNRAPIELNLDDIRLQTKSLFLEVPKIGGIVGIGVQVGVSQDESRRLVMESILSTLMNVVGSVKAIYKYTKDLEYYATRDPLTDLHNQRIFWEMLNYEVLRAQRHEYHFGLLVIDLDNFKSINDGFGHSFGDRYLQEVAKSIREALRAGDMLARYGGDEFTVILPEATLEQTREVAERIQRNLQKMSSVTPSGETLETGMSMGVAVYPEHASSAKDLFMFADNMMYKAKGLGKNRIYIPNEDDVVEVFKDISEKSLLISKAIKEKRVIPYFQPMMGSESGIIEAVEVLSRIQLDGDNVMGAHEFIEIAETMGVIHCLDFAVMEKAFERVNQEQFKGLVFLNMSPRSLVLSEFLPEVKRITEEAGIAPERVVFEITERDTVKNMTMLEKFVGSLKAEGFQLAIDDFGSGFSSFHYLKHFPIDFVKIEGEFVANMVSDAKDNAVVRCIASLAHELHAKTIAEYVESEEVLQAVKSINVTLAQGYHIRRPAPYIFEQPPQPALAESLASDT
ncbi:EAL domain-containing protein [Motiliproteus sediminis]|uniref:EAL domain-containing protein n=1 Tax=Motiliproteus sediminis TaxID=1468178 RepID=UPI001AEFD7AE|nr:EAL domain-containing protein [Motiliproteus sediminis]